MKNFKNHEKTQILLLKHNTLVQQTRKLDFPSVKEQVKHY